jgi:predicted amino acid-binding ACT domain protein
MAVDLRLIEYFRTTVKDQPGEGLAVLSALATEGVNLVAFTAIPHGQTETQLMLFPESAPALVGCAARTGIPLDGPHRAIFVTGDDELGAIADIHRILAHADLNIIASTGLADRCGTFGYIIHLREADIAAASHVLAGAFTPVSA